MSWKTIGGPGFGTGDLALSARIGAPRHSVILHDHSFTEIIIPRRGSALHQTPGDQRKLALGDVHLIPPGMPHALSDLRSLSHSLVMIDLQRCPLPIDDIRELPGYRRLFRRDCRSGPDSWRFATCGHLDREHLRQCQRTCDGLIEELIGQTPGWRSAASARIVDILCLLARHLRPGPAGSPADPVVDGSMARMADDLAAPWRLGELAGAAGCSISHLTERFRARCGRSPMQWLLDRRLREVRRLLAETDTDITGIAIDCGFGDGSYLARCFRRAMGCTPRQWRHQHDRPPETGGAQNTIR